MGSDRQLMRIAKAYVKKWKLDQMLDKEENI